MVGVRWRRFTAVFGPGLVVMLADTDVGSVITAAQSGVSWGYRLLLLQLVLIPILFLVQDLAVRLGIFTGRGHGELIRAVLGPGWAWLTAAALGLAVVGALLTEFSGVAGVGELYGVPRLVSLPLAAAALMAVVLTGSARSVERVALALGLFEFAFFVVAWAAHPDWRQVARGAVEIPWTDPGYAYLAAANIGSVVLPWMIFYQQSAVVEQRLGPADYGAARLDTVIGAVVTQLVMAAVLLACAATIGRDRPGAALGSVGEISMALTPFLGARIGRAVFGAGVLGAAFVAAIVCSQAIAWGLGEVSGYRRALERSPLRARWFAGLYFSGIAGVALLVTVWPDLVALNIGVQVMNALLLPLVLAVLVALAGRALPVGRRPRGIYRVVLVGVLILTCALGLLGGLGGALFQ
jgi:Mn2+/Fe2+ NRAMP family transporter